MPDFSDAWWDVALDPSSRHDAHAAQRRDADGRPLVNAPGEGGRLGLAYDGYLHLDRLLDAQEPASRVPDERIFVVTHQLFELTFKQMAFDLGIVARTFEALLGMDEAAFGAMALSPLPHSDAHGPDAFWRPALTAAARVRHATRRVLPAVMQFMGRGDDDDVLFSTIEFGLFRDMLVPSSGFQTASLRLLQRALGKTPALALALYPGDTFSHHYHGCPVGHVALGDPLILGEGHGRAFPPEDAHEARTAALDAIAHAVLARLAPRPARLPEPPALLTVGENEVSRLVTRFRNTLGPDAGDSATERFRTTVQAVADEENARREGLGDARRGAQALLADAPRSCLAFVLDRLVAADVAFHDPGSDSFLTVHRKTVRQHVADEAGTGGGGMPYLVTSQRFLFPLFPALVAYADLAAMADPEGSSAAERW